MSHRALSWACNLVREEVSTSKKLILLIMANFANDSGEMFIKQSTLSAMTGLVRSTVARLISEMEKDDILSITRRSHANGGQRSSVYKLNLDLPSTRQIDDDEITLIPDETPAVEPDHTSSTTTPPVVEGNTPCRTERHPLSLSTTPPVSQNDTLIQNLDTEQDTKEDNDRPTQSRVDPWPSDAFERFWQMYPNKVGKIAVKKKFDMIRRDGEVEFSDLMAGLRAYVRKRDDRPWCNPLTWLNQGRWDDKPFVMSRSEEIRSRRNVAI